MTTTPADLEVLVRRHGRMLYRAARAILREDAEAEECVVSACLLVIHSPETSEKQTARSAWLARTVVEEANRRLRVRVRFAPLQ